MRCPFCQHEDSRVLDSRVCEDGLAIRRRRQCPVCERRFTTIERMLMVVRKKDGSEEPFSREKVVQGVRKACEGRPVSSADLALLGQRVEAALRASGASVIPSDEVGLAILPPLRDLDPIAYLRFASVYRHYETIDDFVKEIDRLKADGTDRPSVDQGQPAPVRNAASQPLF